MLVVQLKNANRPVNFGDFTPLLTSRSRRSASSRSRVAGTGSRTPAPAGLRASSLGSRSSPRTSLRSGTLQEHRVFSNKNTYHGTWLDGRMHGEGVYTWSDGSQYVGEFHEGCVWGRGEKRWPTGRTYRGEWIRDMMWGNGEMSWPSGETFSGQFRKGIFLGQGTRVWRQVHGRIQERRAGGPGNLRECRRGLGLHGALAAWQDVWRRPFPSLDLLGRPAHGEALPVWPNKIEYVGEWKDGVREGHGKLSWPDGSKYEGQFRNNCIEGRGRKALPDGSWFEGHFHAGELEGHGTFHWRDGTEFEGLWHKSEVVGPGCHRVPDGTAITGVFEARGASGEGTKRWANGCAYMGRLNENQIHQYGILKWPDGRCYVGHFQDEAMHGEGTLTWNDRDGPCRYKGSFEQSAFHGEGTLDWASRARYTGKFREGQYHGEGTFEWPDRLTVYRGQWVHGEMCGRGVLATNGDVGGKGGKNLGEPFVYVGEFAEGHMQGNGRVTFLRPGGVQDHYYGELLRSTLHGHGQFSWASGHLLTGLFDDGVCNGVGKKVYPGGFVYKGQLSGDREHGRGILCHGDCHLAGLWREGRCVEELVEISVQDPEGTASESTRVFVGIREVAQQGSESRGGRRASVGQEGETIMLYLNGDRYVGRMSYGMKDGPGTYLYADLTSHSGVWDRDVLEGTRHPAAEEERPPQALALHKANEQHQKHTEVLRQLGSSSRGTAGSHR